ncbi:MAG: UDP-galactopyranose mutase, partial [Pseudoflavonifractor sp.]
FNLTSLEKAYGAEKAHRLEKKLVDTYGAEKKVTILELRRSEDPEIKALADYVYENVFVHYTMKQWGQRPEEIDPATTARVPVLLSRDDRYFQDDYQYMPQDGYTALFARMLDHPNITVELGVEAADRLALDTGGVRLDGTVFRGPVIYTGAVDELFGSCFGPLPYRTLDFKFETLPVEWYQTHGTVNYTVSEDFTRITEFKYFSGQTIPDKTTIVKEFARAYTGAEGETPYYAIISPESNALYEKYKALGDALPGFHLLGRLAEYKYYNMDTIVLRALELADSLTK